MSRVADRRELILAILGSEAIATQDALVEALAARGHGVSQASVSRDVAALGLLKKDGRYVAPGAAAVPEDPLRERVRGSILEVKHAGAHLVVLKVPPGEASGTALALDRLSLPGAVGSVAGDDTIFVAVSDRRAFTSAL